MTPRQEDALYEFLENVTEPFTLETLVAFLRLMSRQKPTRLAKEISAFIHSRKAAFPLGPEEWISRRGWFEKLRFVILPTRLEIMNGILIPGHRCAPFANPHLFPQEYSFYWKGEKIPGTTAEGAPEEFYPYYTLYGEEYAAQYIAFDNPGNESAYSQDFFEEPLEVSIHTADMRAIYRECSFVPGDRFAVRTLDWKAGAFELEKIDKDAWKSADLQAWAEAAEAGFYESFRVQGPGSTTEEQIAFAYYYGGERMRNLPAYGLDEFLFDKTDAIEVASYGIETRFWFVGKDIPDRETLEDPPSIVKPTYLESLLKKMGVPISEFILQSYVWDALYRKDPDMGNLIRRILPPPLAPDERCETQLTRYLTAAYAVFDVDYAPFLDRFQGPIRQRVGELHTAVMELAARVRKRGVQLSWLPKHTFTILSQIQSHAAGILEDLHHKEGPEESELELIDNSLDSMIETYEDIKELIEDSLQNYRLKKISLVKKWPRSASSTFWFSLQLNLGGTDIWRRIVMPDFSTLQDLDRIIRTLFGWQAEVREGASGEKPPLEEIPRRFREDSYLRETDVAADLDFSSVLENLNVQGITELIYEYRERWTVRILILSNVSPPKGGKTVCVAGEGAPPPAFIEGVLQFRRYLESRGWEEGLKTQGGFDLEECNRLLAALGSPE